MIHAKLIVGGTYSKRQGIIAEIIKNNLGIDPLRPHPDLVTVEGANSIGIEQVRELKNKLSLKPYSALNKVAVISQAEKMTLPAQNALLKTLEEPADKTLLVLGAPKSDSLLTTIISRCQIIPLAQEGDFPLNESKIAQYRQITQKILEARVGERLKEASNLAIDKNQAIEFIQIQLLIFRELMLQKPTTNTINNIRHAQNTLRLLQANVNPTLAIGNLFLCLS